jgi:hypothetical protein
VHTGYSFYHGYAGLVLTQADTSGQGDLYRHLELDAKVSLKGVRMVWLDRRTKHAQDIGASL